MTDCIFCRIANKEIPSQVVYEDEKIFAFKDINPMAPIHILMIPKEHLSSVLDVNEQNADLVGYIMMKAGQLAKEFGIAENGFRIVTNCNSDGGQTVFHLHFHLLGGQPLGTFA